MPLCLENPGIIATTRQGYVQLRIRTSVRIDGSVPLGVSYPSLVPVLREGKLPNNSLGNQDEHYKINPGVYKPNYIYGRSVDARGHQSHKRINFPPALLNTINIVHKDLGYDTVESFIRDSCVHRLHYWQQQDGCPEEVEGMIAMVRAQSAIDDLRHMRQTYESLCRGLMECRTPSERGVVIEQLRIMRDHLPDHMDSVRQDLDGLLKPYD